jgi:hypothetical protein
MFESVEQAKQMLDAQRLQNIRVPPPSIHLILHFEQMQFAASARMSHTNTETGACVAAVTTFVF